MVSILYIGNNLNSKTSNITGIGVLGPLLEQEGCHLYYASSKTNKVLRLRDMLMACFKYRNKVDYVLIDTYSTQNFWYAFLVSQLCRGLSLNYIPVLHGGNLVSRLKNNPVLCRLIFKHAHKNIAPSRFIQSTFEGYGYSNVQYIPNAIELDNYRFKQRTLDEVGLLWVRSFSKIYNPELAVRILKELLDHGLNASLCMVGPDSGDGSLEATMQMAEQLEVEVTFTGKLSKAAWIELSEAYNVFINTTDFDNMPLSVIEAMALGLPVISTHVGGVPYLIAHGEDGILVEPNNATVFVKAIEELMSNPKQVEEMVLKARQKAVSLDWAQVKHQWMSILR